MSSLAPADDGVDTVDVAEGSLERHGALSGAE